MILGRKLNELLAFANNKHFFVTSIIHIPIEISNLKNLNL